MRLAVDELFHQLADLSTGERATFLAEDPPGVDTLREVEELLEHDSGDPLMPPIAAAARLTMRSMDAAGLRCGPFQLVSAIGRGGMGVVYLAERVDGEVRQRAAVKLLHPGWSDAQRERFLQEREILAALSHPNIAHLLDAGHLDDGQPYLAMEYVAGKGIDRYCEGLAARERIELFLKVCAAVEYLHKNHLLHRDLKPGNILVTAEGEPKLLDFGISKMIDVGDATATCLRMLTPSYASPEQMNGGRVGTASDIYSLGVVLKEIVADGLEGDLEVVVRTATRPEPEERYESVEQLAADLRAFLDSKPIRARRGDWIYRARKLTARRRSTVLLGAMMAVTLTAWTGLWPRSRPANTMLTAKRLTANTPEMPIHAAAISPDGKWIAYSDAMGIHLRDTATDATRLLPETAGHVVSHWMPDSGGVVSTIPVGSSLKSMTVSISGGAPAVASAPGVLSPDGKRRAMSPPGVQRVVVEKADGTDSREVWKVTQGRTLNGYVWCPNGQEIAIFSSTGIGSTLEVIDVARGRKSVVVADENKLPIGGLAWPGPNRIVFSTYERSRANTYNSNLWEARLNTRRELAAPGLRQLTAWSDFPIQPGSLTTDGKRLTFVRSFVQRDVYVAGLDSRRRQMAHPRRLTLDLGDDYPTAWTRDSKSVILTSDRYGEAKIFRQDVARQDAEQLAVAPGKQVMPRMAPDGQSVLYCSMVQNDRSCRLMRAPLDGGKPELVDTIPEFADFRCSPAGPCVVTQQDNPPGRIVSELHPVKGKGREIYRERGPFANAPDLSPDGKWLASVAKTKITVRSYATGAVVREIEVRGARQVFTLEYAPDGKGFYAGEFRPTEARQLYVDLSGNTTLLWKQPGRSVIWAVPSPDGKKLAVLMYTTDSNVFLVDGL